MIDNASFSHMIYWLDCCDEKWENIGFDDYDVLTRVNVKDGFVCWYDAIL